MSFLPFCPIPLYIFDFSLLDFIINFWRIFLFCDRCYTVIWANFHFFNKIFLFQTTFHEKSFLPVLKCLQIVTFFRLVSHIFWKYSPRATPRKLRNFTPPTRAWPQLSVIIEEKRQFPILCVILSFFSRNIRCNLTKKYIIYESIMSVFFLQNMSKVLMKSVLKIHKI